MCESAGLVLLMLLAEAVLIEGIEPVRKVCVTLVETSGSHPALRDALRSHKLMRFVGPMH